AKKVYIIHRRDEFRGFESMIEKIKSKKNVEFILDSVVKEFKGDKMLR
ncbi:MAG: NAD-binding protein, partial [Candidatus Aenigmarchaeota archaeon]|nr:NAD-binding protein [Candidatus Aenigmarchaeota archaeon]